MFAAVERSRSVRGVPLSRQAMYSDAVHIEDIVLPRVSFALTALRYIVAALSTT